MKNVKTYVGKLVLTGRLNSSVNGNPRFAGYIEVIERAGIHYYTRRVEFQTAPDAMLAYEIDNFEGRPVIAEIGRYYGKPTIKTIEGVLK